uniref:LysR family transcriptional regulator n=1 Tax=Hafnia alvei TaxID=569 RepID=UPI00242D73C2|nr:LysR family transcriptional regulator [Hafnia alvei]
MNIRALSFFVEVVRRNSFLRAAEALYVTQPAISKAVKKLEEDAGVNLLVRTSKGVETTEAGRVLLNHAINILNSVDTYKSEIKVFKNTLHGNIRVGLPMTISSSFFVDVIGKFKLQYPLVSLDIIEKGSHVLEQMLINDDVDIAAIMLPTNNEFFDIMPFFQDNLVLVVAANNELSMRNSVYLHELQNLPFVFFSDDYKINDYIINLCQEIGFSPNIILKSSHIDLIFSIISKGSCIALLPESTCHELIEKSVRFITLEDSRYAYTLGVVKNKNKKLSREVACWISIVQSEFNLSLGIM